MQSLRLKKKLSTICCESPLLENSAVLCIVLSLQHAYPILTDCGPDLTSVFCAEPLFEKRAAIVQGKQEAPQVQASEEEEQADDNGMSHLGLP